MPGNFKSLCDITKGTFSGRCTSSSSRKWMSCKQYKRWTLLYFYRAQWLLRNAGATAQWLRWIKSRRRCKKALGGAVTAERSGEECDETRRLNSSPHHFPHSGIRVPLWSPAGAPGSRSVQIKVLLFPPAPRPYVLLRRPFTAMPRGSPSRHRAAVQRRTSRCLFFEMRLSCEMSRKHANTNWYLILQAPQRWQLCSQRGAAKRVCCVEGEQGQGGWRVCQWGLPDRKWSSVKEEGAVGVRQEPPERRKRDKFEWLLI